MANRGVGVSERAGAVHRGKLDDIHVETHILEDGGSSGNTVEVRRTSLCLRSR